MKTSESLATRIAAYVEDCDYGFLADLGALCFGEDDENVLELRNFVYDELDDE